MNRLKLILAVADQGLGERMRKILCKEGCAVCFCLSGSGTARAAWLEYLGLTDTRKDVLLAPCAEERASAALQALSSALEGKRHFALSMPMSSIAGRDAYDLLRKGGLEHGESL